MVKTWVIEKISFGISKKNSKKARIYLRALNVYIKEQAVEKLRVFENSE